MKIIIICGLFLVIIVSSHCTKKTSPEINLTDKPAVLEKSSINDPYREFIIGKWEGRTMWNGEENVIVQYLTFEPDGKMIEINPIPNHPFTNKERKFDYEMLGDGVIKTDRFPENLKIIKISDDVISFNKTQGNMYEESVDIVYSCQFYRVKQ